MSEANNLTRAVSIDFLGVLRCLRLLQECPPTIRQIVAAGERAIDAAGLDPQCMDKGLAEGEERYVPRQLEDCIQGVATAISAANICNADGGWKMRVESTPSEQRPVVVGNSLNRLVRWIPVAERLPEGKEVLYWNGEIVSTFFPATGEEDANQAAARCECFGITHWMPMPIPPNVCDHRPQPGVRSQPK
jgi:hypothetical protein